MRSLLLAAMLTVAAPSLALAAMNVVISAGDDMVSGFKPGRDMLILQDPDATVEVEQMGPDLLITHPTGTVLLKGVQEKDFDLQRDLVRQ